MCKDAPAAHVLLVPSGSAPMGSSVLTIPIPRAVGCPYSQALQPGQGFKDPSWNGHMVLQDQEKEWGLVKDAVVTSCVGAFLWE